MKATSLIRLYPRAWRARYGEEFEAFVGNERIGPRAVLDIVLGALDARLAPQPQVAGTANGTATGGRVMELLRKGCGTNSVPRREQLGYAVLAAGGAIGLALAFLVLKQVVGPSIWVEALGGTAGFAAPALYMLVLMREHSLRTRVVFTGGVLLFVYLIGLLAALL